jgi:hypothetical protein
MGPPIAADYPANDRRVTDAANDTDEEQGERSILDRIAQVMASLGGAGPGDERDRLEQERQCLQNELETLRRGLTVDSL